MQWYFLAYKNLWYYLQNGNSASFRIISLYRRFRLNIRRLESEYAFVELFSMYEKQLLAAQKATNDTLEDSVWQCGKWHFANRQRLFYVVSAHFPVRRSLFSRFPNSKSNDSQTKKGRIRTCKIVSETWNTPGGWYFLGITHRLHACYSLFPIAFATAGQRFPATYDTLGNIRDFYGVYAEISLRKHCRKAVKPFVYRIICGKMLFRYVFCGMHADI